MSRVMLNEKLSSIKLFPVKLVPKNPFHNAGNNRNMNRFNDSGTRKPKILIKLLLKSMKSNGRIYDLGAMMRYKFGTGSFFKDAEKFPAMLKKKKIAILPPKGADKKVAKKIFKELKIRINKDKT